jgi:hypothetical protein
VGERQHLPDLHGKDAQDSTAQLPRGMGTASYSAGLAKHWQWPWPLIWSSASAIGLCRIHRSPAAVWEAAARNRVQEAVAMLNQPVNST